MKKFIFVFFAFLSLSFSHAAEVIETVYFNPSRLGHYESLKIAENLTAPGKITTNHISLASDVDVSNSGDYTISNAMVSGRLTMDETRFVIGNIGNMKGTASFIDTTATSSIDTLDTLSASAISIRGDKVSAKTIEIDGKLKVPPYTTSLLNPTTIHGLSLGKNVIPSTEFLCPSSVALYWASRTATQKGSTDEKIYKVLAISTCK